MAKFTASVLWGLWIGASDHGKEGHFMWDNGEKLISPGYTNWGPNQPDNEANNEDCILYGPYGFLWNDIDCDHKSVGGVCEKHP